MRALVAWFCCAAATVSAAGLSPEAEKALMGRGRKRPVLSAGGDGGDAIGGAKPRKVFRWKTERKK